MTDKIITKDRHLIVAKVLWLKYIRGWIQLLRRTPILGWNLAGRCFSLVLLELLKLSPYDREFYCCSNSTIESRRKSTLQSGERRAGLKRRKWMLTKWLSSCHASWFALLSTRKWREKLLTNQQMLHLRSCVSSVKSLPFSVFKIRSSKQMLAIYNCVIGGIWLRFDPFGKGSKQANQITIWPTYLLFCCPAWSVRSKISRYYGSKLRQAIINQLIDSIGLCWFSFVVEKLAELMNRDQSQ